MIKIFNMSKEAFKKCDAVLPDGWYCKETLIEEVDTYNLSINSYIQITKPSGEDKLFLSDNINMMTIDIDFSDFSTVRIV